MFWAWQRPTWADSAPGSDAMPSWVTESDRIIGLSRTGTETNSTRRCRMLGGWPLRHGPEESRRRRGPILDCTVSRAD
eukprot:757939-Hanusia_phi.AAC.2